MIYYLLPPHFTYFFSLFFLLLFWHTAWFHWADAGTPFWFQSVVSTEQLWQQPGFLCFCALLFHLVWTDTITGNKMFELSNFVFDRKAIKYVAEIWASDRDQPVSNRCCRIFPFGKLSLAEDARETFRSLNLPHTWAEHLLTSGDLLIEVWAGLA